jgi:hypothetical protein
MLALACAAALPGLCPLPTSGAATLSDFGYQNMNVNGVLASGSRPLLVILVNFAGQPPLPSPPSFFADLIFNSSRFPSFNGYFQAVSNGRFSYSNAGVIGPLALTAAETESGWPSDSLYCSNIVYKAMVSGLVNFGSFDANHDGHVTHDELAILIMNEDNVWGWRPAGIIKPAGFAYDWSGGVTVLTAQAPFAVMVEETEEGLGPIDIYGYGCGSSCCLSSGLSPQSCWIDSTSIYYLDPWNRMQLGWCEPRIRSLTDGGIQSIPANQYGNSTAPIILYDPVRGTNEFFILEYRTPTSPVGSGYDANVAASGLAVWHIKQDANHNAVAVPTLDGLNFDKVVWNEGPPSFQRGTSTLWGSGSVSTNLSWLGGAGTSTHLHVLPYNVGNGSITVEWLSAADTWVDFNWGAPNSGTFAAPYNTLAAGLAHVSYGGTLNFKTGSTHETNNIIEPMLLKAYNGPVLIGH